MDKQLEEPQNDHCRNYPKQCALNFNLAIVVTSASVIVKRSTNWIVERPRMDRGNTTGSRAGNNERVGRH
jgi:hypothetical protein